METTNTIYSLARAYFVCLHPHTECVLRDSRGLVYVLIALLSVPEMGPQTQQKPSKYF